MEHWPKCRGYWEEDSTHPGPLDFFFSKKKSFIDTRWERSKQSLIAALMMIDMNGPDIQEVHEVKEIILESVNEWKNYDWDIDVVKEQDRFNPTEQ